MLTAAMHMPCVNDSSVIAQRLIHESMASIATPSEPNSEQIDTRDLRMRQEQVLSPASCAMDAQRIATSFLKIMRVA